MIYAVREDNGETSYIYYQPNVVSPRVVSDIYNWLDGMTDFRCGYIHEMQISREQKWYHTKMEYFSREWTKEYPRWQSFEYCDTLRKYQGIVQDLTNNVCDIFSIKKHTFNSCLINKYNNGDNFIKEHSDSQTTFGDNPTIAILSVGTPRTMNFTRRYYNPKNIRNVIPNHSEYDLNKSITLEPGSLLIMAGATQKYFCHSIDRAETDKKRYSLTFREYIS